MSLIVGELAGILSLDADPFERGIDRAMRQAEQTTGARMQATGDKMTKSLTLPLVAVGAGAAKLATDFETTFARMVGLADVPAGEVDHLRESILSLAGETAVAPQELADALYDAASAGLTSAQALEATKVAARAAAAGLGETGDIVGLIASATASYGSEAMDAAKATDILTATIRAGRADPDELAGTLGRILPVASQLGITFDQVGGAVAYLSNVFGDTNRTVTALSGFMVKLVSPTQQGRKALEEMGTSVEELQARVSEDGILGALDLLREKGFGENQQALRALFDDIEGFQGALALLNDESGTLADAMAETAGSTGALGEAFDAAQTDGMKARRAWAELQVALIRVGDILLPLIGNIAEFGSTMLRWFSMLPGPAQQVVVVLGMVLAATGPLLSAGGRLITTWGRVAGLFQRTASAAPAAVSGMSSLTAATMRNSTTSAAAAGGISKMGMALGALGIVGAVAGLAALASQTNKVTVNVDELARATANLSEAEAEQLQQHLVVLAAWGDLDDVVRQTAESNVIAAERLLEQAEAAGITGDELQKLKDIVDSKRESDVQGSKDQEEYSQQLQEATGASEDLADATADTTSELEKQAKELDAVLDALDALVAAHFGLEGAQDRLQSKVNDLADVLKDAKKEGLDLNNAMADQSDGAIRLRDHMRGLATDAAGVIEQWIRQGVKGQDLKDRIDLLSLSLRMQADAAGVPIPVVDHYLGLLGDIPEAVGTDVHADVSEAERVINEFINRSRTARIQVQIDNPNARVGGVQLRARGGPFAPGWVLAGEEGPELIRMDGAGHVFTAAETARMLGGGRIGSNTGHVDNSRRIDQMHLHLQTNDSPRRWLDEGLWRVAG